MNVVFVMCDTFRRDFIGAYGNDWIKTPCLDRFSEKAFVFDRCYMNSFPTVPNRWDILVGKNNFTYAAWQPLSPDEVVVPQVLDAQECVSMMIHDTPHIQQNGFNYSRGFSGWQWIRGQENDRLRTAPEEVDFACDPNKMRNPDFIVTQYLRNVSQRRKESDWFVAQTMTAACDWLERNYQRDDFFLYIDTFDPHEPFDPPQHYVDMYDPGYDGEVNFYPHYAPANYLEQDELDHTRALYSGKVTLTDRWIGNLLNKIEDLGLTETTAVIFTTDHGFMFGEHDLVGKDIIMDEFFETIWMYKEVAHIPLMIRLPEQEEGARIDSLVTSVDLMPTLLEMYGAIETGVAAGESTVQLLQCGFHRQLAWSLDVDALHGRSLVPLMMGDTDKLHDIAVSSFPLNNKTARLAKSAIVSDDNWVLHYAGETDPSLEEPEVPATFGGGFEVKSGLNEGDYKLGDYEPKLYNLEDDPDEISNVIDDNKDKAKDLHAKYVEYLEKCNTPEEYLALRRKLDL